MKTSRLIPLIVIIGLLFTLPVAGASGPAKSPDSSRSPEIQALLSTNQIDQQQAAIRALVLRIGPEAAQEELLASGLPFTGQSHLIIHTVGSMIYKKFGAQGVGHCRPYFLGGCFHGFMIDAISEHGPDAVLDAWPACEKAGPAVPDQCAHAVGHGLLAWNKYSLTDALTACDTIAARQSGLSAFNCYDGVFMEKIWKVHGHGHDHSAPQPQVAADLDYPCDDPQLQPKHLNACWGNQASVLYQAFNGDLARVAQKCDSLKDPGSKEFCFNGLARQIHPLTNGSTDEAFRLCAKTISGPWQDYCLITIAGSAFSVGDQVNMPFQICNRIREGARTSCYQRLFPLIHLYAQGSPQRADSFCARMEDRQSAESCRQYQRHFESLTASDAATPAAQAKLSSQPGLEAAAPKPVSDQYPSPYTSPYYTPYSTPYAIPYSSPYVSPYSTPYYTPYINPYDTPYISPYINPYDTPYINPYDTPYINPYDTPYINPYDTPYVNPYDTPYDTPYTTPYATPLANP